MQNKIDEDMKKMNEAAMKAYMVDVSAGADMTSRAISMAMNSGREESRKQVDPMMPLIDPYAPEHMPSVSKTSTTVAQAPVNDGSLWCEAITDEGHTYYWNVKTNGE